MRLLIFLACCFSLFSKPLQMDVKAGSAVLMNADTGAILYEKHPHAPMYPASTTKIATALYILSEKQPRLDQKMTVSAESLRMKPKSGECPPYWWDIEGTRMGLQTGESLHVEALLHGLMMVSGNDAANVLAEGLCGTVPGFMDEANEFLKKIGCTETRFLNPHGCHHPDHISTAYDLCLMTKAALRLPLFRELVSKLSYMKPKTNKQGPAELKQANQLLNPGRLHYPKAIGVKTGFHSHGQNCLVAAAVHEGRTLIAAVLGATNKSDRYTDAIRMFESAFAEKLETKRIFGREHLFVRQVLGAKKDLTAALGRDLSISYFPAEEPACRAFVYWNSTPLPIQKGQIVGEVRVVDEKGAIIAKSDLFAKEEVKGTLMFVLKETVGRLFR